MELRLAIDVWLILVALAAGLLGGMIGAWVVVRRVGRRTSRIAIVTCGCAPEVH